jgi:hypothetical protein
MEQRQADFRELFSSAAEWRPHAGLGEAPVFRGAAGGRLVQLLDRTGQPYLRTEAADPAQPYSDPNYRELPVLAGVWQGRFAVLR